MLKIEKLIADYKIFFDTCSLMQPLTHEYVSKTLIPTLNEAGATVIVPLRVHDELRKLINREGDTGKLATSGLRAVALMLETGALELFGNESDTSFADNYFLYLFTKLRLQHNLALITQDKKLALDIHDLANHRSVQGRKKIILLKIENDDLVEWKLNGEQESEKVEVKTKFLVCSAPRNVSSKAIHLDRLPAAGDTVSSTKYGDFVLGAKTVKSRGGYVYPVSRGLACKIYSPKNLTTFQLEKLEKMLQVPVEVKGICWPLDIVRGQNGDFLGYLIPEAAGVPIKEAVFSKRSLEDNFPHWTRKELVELCLTILKKIKGLYDINVLVGDLTPAKFFVRSEKEVYLIETDTYQVEDIPSLHTSMDFIAPELRGERNGTFLQTQEQEYYGLATLLFMILLPGKHPFSCRSGDALDDRMRCLEFPYPLGENKSRHTPGKPWKFIWSNLPYKIKRMFYTVFTENTRISADAWNKALKEYLVLLDNGYMSKEIFPTKRKILNPCEVICSRCGTRELQELKWIESLVLGGKIYYCERCLEQIRHGSSERDTRRKNS